MSEKAKAKSGTIKKDTVAIILVIVLIVGYVFYECYSVSHIQLETQTALLSTVYETIDATAIVVRDEHSLDNASSGITVPTLATGDKINVGGNVAMTFSSNEDATAYSKYVKIQEEIEYYENIEAQTVGQAASVESIGNEINDDVDSYIQAISSGKVEKINGAGSTVNNALLRRQMIIGESVDLASIIQSLRTEAESYASSSKSNGFIKTDSSGVFSSYTDGFENIYDYSNVQNITIDEIEKSIKKVEKANDTSSKFGKLITSYSWYLACVVDCDKVKSLQNGNQIEIALKNNSNLVLNAEIVSGAEPSLGQEKTALVLKCNTLNEELTSLRCENIEIRVKENQGFKVPADALHVVDGKKGVYVLISSQIRFREADVIYSNGDYVVLSYNQDDSKGIRLYDKIILQGKDLEDGRVYT